MTKLVSAQKALQRALQQAWAPGSLHTGVYSYFHRQWSCSASQSKNCSLPRVISL